MQAYQQAADFAFKMMICVPVMVMGDDGWIPVEERLPEDERANYEVTFINECGYEEHGFAQWYDGEFHIPAVVIAWREHLEPYRPEPLETRKELEEDSKGGRDEREETVRMRTLWNGLQQQDTVREM